MIDKSPDLGRDVDAYCGKCKMVLAHTVTAKVESRIVRVLCNTCKAEHGYRPGPGSSASRARSTRSEPRRQPKTRGARGDYARLLNGRDSSEAKAYSPRSTFVLSELVQHPTFGLGVVSAVKSAGKVEVVFPEAVKVLVHDRAKAAG